MNKKLTAIVPAAGIGKRAATPGDLPKQYRLLGGVAVLRLTIMALLAEPRIHQVVVAVAAGDTMAADVLGDLDRVRIIACGGPDRADTVRNALYEIAYSNDEWVLVHDAARPGLPAGALARLIDTCWAKNNGGILALPVADTLKYSVSDGEQNYCQRTVSRHNLWQAQTPQMFLAANLHDALKQNIGNPAVTDEASAIELSGFAAPLLIIGAQENFKLTYPADFDWYEEFILKTNV